MANSIPESRLKKYSHFTSVNSTNNNYNPEKGLEALYASITPDPKVIVLHAIPDNRTYSTSGQLYKECRNFLDILGLSGDLFPIESRPLWGYFERIDKKGNVTAGSLVKKGIVKEVRLQNLDGTKSGYMASTAIELARIIGLGAMEFVYQATKSGIQHNFDSMWKILSGTNSSSDKHRQIAVSDLIEFLIENPNVHRTVDIIDAFKEKYNDSVISNIINSLGYAGTVDYVSPQRDIKGERFRGLVKYRLNLEGDKNLLLETADLIHEEFKNTEGEYKKYIKSLQTLVDFIKNNPNKEYEYNELGNKFNLNPITIARLLSGLSKLGYLTSDFTSHEVRSRLQANKLTNLFYELVILPAKDLAYNLSPESSELKKTILTANKVRTFLDNYQEERTSIGIVGGKEIRDAIRTSLKEGNKKLSHVTQDVIEAISRRVSSKAVNKHLNTLIKNKEVFKTDKWYYSLA